MTKWVRDDTRALEIEYKANTKAVFISEGGDCVVEIYQGAEGDLLTGPPHLYIAFQARDKNLLNRIKGQDSRWSEPYSYPSIGATTGFFIECGCGGASMGSQKRFADSLRSLFSELNKVEGLSVPVTCKEIYVPL